MTSRPLAFVHIPKTAGTSLVKVVNLCGLRWWHVPAGLYVPEHDAFVGGYRQSIEQGTADLDQDKYELLFGHFTVRDLRLGYPNHRRLRYATFLRDPVERVVSEYFYSVSAVHPGSAATLRLFPSFEYFVHENPETEVIARFLEEYRGESADRISDRLLNSYAMVGLSDEFDSSARHLRQVLGVREFTATARENITRDKPDAIPDRLRQIIVERNARDVAIFQAVAPVIKRRLANLSAPELPVTP